MCNKLKSCLHEKVCDSVYHVNDGCSFFIPKNFQNGHGENNPFCSECEEEDCEISLDNTCEMIRVYKKAKELEG